MHKAASRLYTKGFFSTLMSSYDAAGVMFDEESTRQVHAAFIHELERLNNASSADKVDRYPKPIDSTDSFNISKTSQHTIQLLILYFRLVETVDAFLVEIEII
jgi:hypothetical protein